MWTSQILGRAWAHDAESKKSDGGELKKCLLLRELMIYSCTHRRRRTTRNDDHAMASSIGMMEEGLQEAMFEVQHVGRLLWIYSIRIGWTIFWRGLLWRAQAAGAMRAVIGAAAEGATRVQGRCDGATWLVQKSALRGARHSAASTSFATDRFALSLSPALPCRPAADWLLQ